MTARVQGKQRIPLMLCHAQLLVWVFWKVTLSEHAELQLPTFWMRSPVEHHCVMLPFSYWWHVLNSTALKDRNKLDLSVLNGYVLKCFLISLMSFVTNVDLFLILKFTSLVLYSSSSPCSTLSWEKTSCQHHHRKPVASAEVRLLLFYYEEPRQHFMYVRCI